MCVRLIDRVPDYKIGYVCMEILTNHEEVFSSFQHKNILYKLIKLYKLYNNNKTIDECGIIESGKGVMIWQVSLMWLAGFYPRSR